MRHSGELAEWSNAAVLKTVEGHTSGGSNPSFSAKQPRKHFMITRISFFIVFFGVKNDLMFLTKKCQIEI